MARPKKNPETKRDKRLTLYLTGGEEEQLNLLAESTGINKTKIIARALQDYVKRLEDPPEPIKKSRLHEVMSVDKESVKGYACVSGHLLWLEWAWPSPPERCPCCGNDEFISTWSGIVKKGLQWEAREGREW